MSSRMRSPYLWLTAFAFLVSLSSLTGGFWMDDYMLVAQVDGLRTDTRPWWELYSFSIKSREGLETGLGDYGPWWSSPELAVEFWRPLSSATIAFDRWIFGDSAAGFHLDSALWYLALVVAAMFLYRQLLPVKTALLASLIYSLDESHAFVTHWISNRHALVSASFAAVGLWAYSRWREGGESSARWLALVCLAASLTGGETGLAPFGFIAAYELVGRSGSWRSRLRPLAPFIVLVMLYLGHYILAGYGTRAMGLYTHPLHEPALFVAQAVRRIPTMAAGLLAGWPLPLWLVFEAARPFFVVGGAAAMLAVLALSLRPRLFTGNETLREQLRCFRWLGLGTLLSVLPLAASFPHDRNLLIPGLGASALVAMALQLAWQARRHAARPLHRFLWGSASVGLFVPHLLLGPLGYIGSHATLSRTPKLSRELALTAELDERLHQGDAVVVINSADLDTSLYPAWVRSVHGRDLVRYWETLSLAPHDLKLHRVGPRDLELELLDGQMLGTMYENVFRSPRDPLQEGQEIMRPLFRAKVLTTAHGRPTRVRFSFTQPLDDPSLHFLSWSDGALRQQTLPAEGESILLPYSAGPAMLPGVKLGRYD